MPKPNDIIMVNHLSWGVNVLRGTCFKLLEAKANFWTFYQMSWVRWGQTNGNTGSLLFLRWPTVLRPFPGTSLCSQAEGGYVGTGRCTRTATTNGSCKLDSTKESTKEIWPQGPFPRAGRWQMRYTGQPYTEALQCSIPKETHTKAWEELSHTLRALLPFKLNKPTCHKSNQDTWQCFVPGRLVPIFFMQCFGGTSTSSFADVHEHLESTGLPTTFPHPTHGQMLQPHILNSEEPSSSKPCGKQLQHTSLTSRGQPSSRTQNSICRLTEAKLNFYLKLEKRKC